MNALIGLLAGVLLGLFIPFYIPSIYLSYINAALFSVIDAALGGIRARLALEFSYGSFYLGLATTLAISAGLVYFGKNLGIDASIALIILFGMKYFHNIAAIRKILLNSLNKSDKIQKYELTELSSKGSDDENDN